MKSRLTLSKRLNFFFVLYSACIFLLCCGLTLVSLYAIEDGFFDRKLKKVANKLINSKEYAQQSQTLKYGIIYYPDVTKSDFVDVDFADVDSEKWDQQSYELKEVSINQRYYHVLLLPRLSQSANRAGQIKPDEQAGSNQPILAYDVTDELVVTNSLDDLSTLFVILLFVMALATLFFSNFFSHIILKPLQKLLDVVILKSDSSELQHAQVKQLSETIKEEDIKLLVLTIADNLQRQERLLTEQITFNKGISHELGTPLQVAKHAMELIKPNDSVSERALIRLQQALEKMEQTSEAFLWLTSENAWATPTEATPIIENLISRNALLLQKHRVSIDTQYTTPCSFIAPPEVLTVVFENLLWNAVIHKDKSGDQDNIVINVDANRILFSNSYSAEDLTEGFGIGMLLVKQLANRFVFLVETKKNNNHFTTRVISNCSKIENE